MKFGLSWDKMAVTHIVTHLNMFLDILEFTEENKKNCLGKTVLKIWSQMLTKNGLSVHKLLLEKSAKTKKKKYIY